MFGDLIQSISDTFSDAIDHLCVPCFLEGLVKGFLVGAGVAAVMTFVAALSPLWATALAIGLAVAGAVAIVNLIQNWQSMSDAQKSEAVGELIGGTAGGWAGGRGASSAMRGFEGGETGTSIAGIRSASTISAEEANAPFVAKGWEPPYASDEPVTKFTAGDDINSNNFVRVHGDGNQAGAWIVPSDDIAGMTPAQIKQYLALPQEPTQISDVFIPEGTSMQMGKIAAQPKFGVSNTGGTQYQLLDRTAIFSNARPLK